MLKVAMPMISMIVLLAACAPAPKAEQAEHAQQRAADAYEAAIAAQTENPQMIEYIKKEICQKPQPERAQRANELIRTNHIDVADAFDDLHPANFEGAGPVVTVPIPCHG